MHRYLLVVVLVVTAALMAPAGSLDAQEEQAAAETERDRVRRVQEALIQFGYKPGPPDGAMGGRTRRAIRYYQGDHGLDVDGEITQDLLEHIDKALIARGLKAAPVAEKPAAPPTEADIATADEAATELESAAVAEELAEETAPPAESAEPPKDNFIRGLARGLTGLFGGGQSADAGGGNTATIGIRGLSKEGLKTAHPNPAELAKLDHYRAAPEQAREYAAGKQLAARDLPYLPEKTAKPAETSGTLPSGGR